LQISFCSASQSSKLPRKALSVQVLFVLLHAGKQFASISANSRFVYFCFVHSFFLFRESAEINDKSEPLTIGIGFGFDCDGGGGERRPLKRPFTLTVLFSYVEYGSRRDMPLAYRALSGFPFPAMKLKTDTIRICF
jgi:hypothetical protein